MCNLGVKLQKFDEPQLNLVVVFEARRIKGVTLLQPAEDCKTAVYLRKVWGNKCFHTDSISPSLAAEGAVLV